MRSCTFADKLKATEYLTVNEWDITNAVSNYFRDSTGELEATEDAPEPAAAVAAASGPSQPAGEPQPPTLHLSLASSYSLGKTY